MLKSLLLATIITTSFTNIEANHINRLARLSQNNINRRTLQTYGQNQQNQQNPQIPQDPLEPHYPPQETQVPVTPKYTPQPTTTTARPTTTTARPTTARPTTARPTTARPTTTTARPTTARPTTARPTTARPTTARPTTTTARPTITVTPKKVYTPSPITSKKIYTPSPTTTRKICPQIYAPVCCSDGETYSNQCIATSNGLTSCKTGACPTPIPHTRPSCKCDKVIDNQCYCRTVVTKPNIVNPPRSKGSKGSKGKHSKGKHSKGKSGNSLALAGLGGIGDCDCEGGQITLALMYQGPGTVNIEWYIAAKGGKSGGKSGDANSNNGGTLICSNSFVTAGDEILCDTQNPSAPGAVAMEKLGTNTLIVIKDVESNANRCSTSIHTSCSQDIVGYSYCEDSSTGVMDIIVTGWKDKNNLYDGGECGYSFQKWYEKCNCIM